MRCSFVVFFYRTILWHFGDKVRLLLRDAPANRKNKEPKKIFFWGGGHVRHGRRPGGESFGGPARRAGEGGNRLWEGGPRQSAAMGPFAPTGGGEGAPKAKKKAQAYFLAGV